MTLRKHLNITVLWHRKTNQNSVIFRNKFSWWNQSSNFCGITEACINNISIKIVDNNMHMEQREQEISLEVIARSFLQITCS